MNVQRQIVTYHARNRRSAEKKFRKDLPSWEYIGYRAYSIQYFEEKRGCLSRLFGTILFPTDNRLVVTYDYAGQPA